jgi:cation:H+ antiporter
LDWLTLLGGLIVLLLGGEALVRGATSLARTLGVSSMVIGMTVVAFGTSAPELGVNVAAAWNGRTAITFGNVVGSNIANIGLILGLTAIVGTLKIHRSIVTREIPMMLAATAGMILLSSDWLFQRTPDVIDFRDGVCLLSGFAVFLAWTVRNALRSRRDDSFIQEARQEQQQYGRVRWKVASALTGLGLAGVLLGSHWTVAGATQVAQTLGMSESVIGLTIVAIGTSLPELTTSLFAARQGHADLAIGNIVGSNVFNLLFILGVSSSIHAVAVPAKGGVDLLMLAVFSAILLPLASSQRKLKRSEGMLLLLMYMAYMVWRTIGDSATTSGI